MNKVRRLFVLPVIIVLLAGVFMPGKVVYAGEILHNESVILGGNTYTIRSVDDNYSNNVYLSLRDMATVLADTDAAFGIEVTSTTVAITLGEAGDTNRPLEGWSDEEKEAYFSKSLASNEIKVNDELRKYYTIRASYQDGTDCFMSLSNLAMILDINMYQSGKDSVVVEADKKLVISPESLEENGFFLEVNSALVGDATTGQILYEYRGDTAYPIASTTKLMTCLLAEEAIADGRISEDMQVTFSDEAKRISNSSDGYFALSTDISVTVRDLMIGALLPSSNECAMALGEAISGDEESFVELMNSRASELSMSTAVFYNANGLPSYGVNGMPGKRQNMMSAEDMFKMCSHLLNNYPQITEITSMKMASLKVFGRDVNNTNALLYNMPEVTGLKTGTTDKAGACLVTSLTVNDGMMDHDLVVVVLGADGSKARFTDSEILARFGRKVIQGEQSANGTYLDASSENGDGGKEVITAEKLVNMIVKEALKKKDM